MELNSSSNDNNSNNHTDNQALKTEPNTELPTSNSQDTDSTSTAVDDTTAHNDETNSATPVADSSRSSSRSGSRSNISGSKPINRRTKILSLQSKLQLLADIDTQIGSRRSIAAKYGIPHSTLSTILKNRHKIEAASKILLFEPGRKRMRESNFSEIDRQLFSWVRISENNKQPVTNYTVTDQAEKIADELGIYDFKASASWIERFKKRHGIVFSKPSAKKDTSKGSCSKASTRSSTNGMGDLDNLDEIISSVFKPPKVNKEAASDWTKDFLPYVLDEYQPEDIFCADETELFFKWLPDKLQPASKGKNNKDKVSVLIGVNMTGIEKLPLLIVGKQSYIAARVKSLPLDYLADKNATISSSMFEAWLQQLDESFAEQNRKIVLVLNASKIHSSAASSKLSSVKVIFIPENTTSILNPCRQGIIHSFKMHYRTRIVQKYILHARIEINKGNFHCAENFNLSIANALLCMRAAWDQVEKDTIYHSFRHAGFYVKQNHPVIEDSAYSHLSHLLQRLGQLVPVNTTATSYVDIDKDLQASSHLDLDSQENASSSTDSNAAREISTSEALKALETIKLFAQQKDNANEMFQALTTIEFKLESMAVKESATNSSVKQEVDVLDSDENDIADVMDEDEDDDATDCEMAE